MSVLKKPGQYCTGRVRIVKPKINQSSLSFDTAGAGRYTFLGSGSFHVTFDGKRVGIGSFVGRDGYRFGKGADALGVVANFDDVAFAGHDRFFRVGRNRASAGTFGRFDDERLVAGIGKFEFADRIAAFVNGTVVNGGDIEGHDSARCALRICTEHTNYYESENGDNLFHRKLPF